MFVDDLQDDVAFGRDDFEPLTREELIADLRGKIITESVNGVKLRYLPTHPLNVLMAEIGIVPVDVLNAASKAALEALNITPKEGQTYVDAWAEAMHGENGLPYEDVEIEGVTTKKFAPAFASAIEESEDVYLFARSLGLAQPITLEPEQEAALRAANDQFAQETGLL